MYFGLPPHRGRALRPLRVARLRAVAALVPARAVGQHSGAQLLPAVLVQPGLDSFVIAVALEPRDQLVFVVFRLDVSVDAGGDVPNLLLAALAPK